MVKIASHGFIRVGDERKRYGHLPAGDENGGRFRQLCFVTCHTAIARFIVAPGSRGWCIDHGHDYKGVTWLILLGKTDGKLDGPA